MAQEKRMASLPQWGREGDGSLFVQNQSGIPAGSGFTFNVPDYFSFEYRTLQFQLVTNLVAGNRIAILTFTWQSVILARVLSQTNRGPSTNTVFLFARWQFAEVLASGNLLVPIPQIWVPPGTTIALTVSSMDVGDQISNAVWSGVARQLG